VTSGAPLHHCTRLAGTVILAAVTFGACEETTTETLVPARVIAVPDSARLVPGGAVQLVALVVDREGRPLPDIPATFRSTDESVVTVSVSGLVRAAGPLGSAKVVVQAAQVDDTVPVTVVAATAALKVIPADTTVARTRSFQLQAMVFDSAGQPVAAAPLTFLSGNAAVAQVTPDGLVTTIDGPSSTSIRVESGSLVTFALVRVIDSRVLLVEPADTTIPAGDSYPLRAAVVDTVTGDTVHEASITFTSSDPSYATVSPSGVVEGVGGPGEATVTVRSGALERSVVVRVLDPSLAGRTSLPGGPFGLAVSVQGVAYVTLAATGRVARIDLPQTDTVLSFSTGDAPTSVTFDAVGARAFVTNQASGNVGTIDVASNQMTSTETVSGNPFVVRVSPNDEILWVTITRTESQLLGIDLSTGIATDSFPLPGPGNGIAFHPTNDSLLYVSDVFGRLTELNFRTDAVLRTITLGGTPQGVAVSPDGQELYVANEGTGQLQIVNLATGVVSGVPVGGGPFDLQLSPDDSEIWLGMPAIGRVVVMDRLSRLVTRTITTGGGPRRMAFAPSGLMVVANEAGWVDFIR